MPKAARARVASPPAGTALARVIRHACRVTSEMGEIRSYVTETGTMVNVTVTSHLRHCRT